MQEFGFIGHPACGGLSFFVIQGMYVCMYVCMYDMFDMYGMYGLYDMYVCMHVGMQVYTCMACVIYINTGTSICHVLLCVYTCVYIYIYTHI